MFPSSLARKVGWLLLPLLALVGLGIFLRTVPNPGGVRERLERLRAAGLPTTPAELDAWYVTPPPAQNLALPVLDVAAALRGAERLDTNLPWLGRGPIPPSGVPLELGLRTRLEGFVRTNREALKVARAAAERPSSRYPVVLSAGGLNARFPDLSPVRTVAGALVLEAVVAAEEGAADLAAADLVAGVRVADSLVFLPVSQWVNAGQSLYRIVAQGSQRVLGQHLLSDAQLLGLQQAWSNSLTIPIAERALVGSIALYEPIQSMSVSEALNHFDPGTDGSTESFVETVRLGLYVAAGGLRTDYGVLVENWDERRLAAQLEYPQRLAKEAKLKAELEDRFRSSYLPAARYFTSADHEGRAQSVALRRAAVTACAVERYRLQHASKLPTQLEQLVPEFLPTVPLDPFDGRPLRYVPSREGYVLYSVGPDKVDDRGRPNQRSRKPGEPTTWDVTFAVGPIPGQKPDRMAP
ncbi:MAG: hypothetical protein J0M24_04980 [Verrucomicrobia bacterium]|nr:hypothetical protein [Verrucomicrobiota bacterium]